MRRVSVLLMWTTVVLAGCGPADTARTAQAGKTAAAGEDMRARAERGDAVAQFELGNAYYAGKGLPQDDAQAVAWFRRAAEQGHAGAQSALGGAYAIGWGVSRDDGQAVGWWRKAAEQGDAVAQLSVSGMYVFGQGGLAKDSVQAYMWASLAAARASAEYQKQCADARDALAKELTPAQLAEAQTRAAAWTAAFAARQVK